MARFYKINLNCISNYINIFQTTISHYVLYSMFQKKTRCKITAARLTYHLAPLNQFLLKLKIAQLKNVLVILRIAILFFDLRVTG